MVLSFSTADLLFTSEINFVNKGRTNEREILPVPLPLAILVAESLPWYNMAHQQLQGLLLKVPWEQLQEPTKK